MTSDDWANPADHFIGFLIRGEAGEYHLTARGEAQPDRSFLVIMNAYHEPVSWTLPALEVGLCWDLVFDTDNPEDFAVSGEFDDGSVYEVPDRSFVLFVRKEEQAELEEIHVP